MTNIDIATEIQSANTHNLQNSVISAPPPSLPHPSPVDDLRIMTKQMTGAQAVVAAEQKPRDLCWNNRGRVTGNADGMGAQRICHGNKYR